MNSPNMKYASAASKALPLGCLFVTFAVSLALFLIRNERYTQSLPGMLQYHRNVSQVFVQILSSILAIAQMLIITSLINFATRIKLFNSMTSISRLSFWSALSIPRFDTGLPSVSLIPVTLMLVLGTGLGALWAGSLTPLSVTTSRNGGQVLVPKFNDTIAPTIYADADDGAIMIRCSNNQTADPRGPQFPLLDHCIVMSKLGNLIMTAATATNTNLTGPRQHPKIDNSTWIYYGRSYGKGSLTGLLDAANTTAQSEGIGFSYQESGFEVQASCSKQETTVFPFQGEYDAGGVGKLNIWSANTVFLDSANVSIPPFYLATPTFNQHNSHPFGYSAWTAFAYNDTYYIATSAQPDSWSSALDNFLCMIQFIPQVFQVNVSTIQKTITVNPLEKIEIFNQTGNIADAIILELDLVSRMSSSSPAFTSLFSAIGNNFAAAKIAYEVDNDTAWEYSLRDAIIEVADDLLTYHGILAVSGDSDGSIPQPAQIYFVAAKIGQIQYQVAQLVINIMLCAVYLFEAYRTRYWKELPDFDFLDIKPLTLAALGPESFNELDSTTTLSNSSNRLGRNERTKLMARYDEQSRPRLFYSSDHGAQQRSSSPSELSSYLLRERGELSGYLLRDRGELQGEYSTARNQDSMKVPLMNPISFNRGFQTTSGR